MTVDGEAQDHGVVSPAREAVRSRLVDVAVRLLGAEGPGAVTTRAVAAAAGVQAPTIYRIFGDKDGLLDAVAERAAEEFIASKAHAAETEAGGDADPVEDLRSAFFAQVDFAVANPEVFRLLGDPARVLRSGAARSGREVLQARIRRVALAGRLRVPPGRCADMIQSAGAGVIQTLLATPVAERDPQLAAAMWEAVALVALTREEPDAEEVGAGRRASALISFRAMAPQMPGLSAAERNLLVDWLHRTDPGTASRT